MTQNYLKIRWLLALLLVMGLPLLSACRTADKGNAESLEPPQAGKYTEALLKQVRRYTESVNRSSDGSGVIRKKPYFYREYGEYPAAPSETDISIQETESRTRPFLADVKLDKVRYVTRLHRERREAREDTDFLRQTGEETQTWVFQNGKWKRAGAMFVTEKIEEKQDGNWLLWEKEEPVFETGAEEKGWLRRTWSRIFGRD
jgi:hypothetical protein